MFVVLNDDSVFVGEKSRNCFNSDNYLPRMPGITVGDSTVTLLYSLLICIFFTLFSQSDFVSIIKSVNFVSPSFND